MKTKDGLRMKYFVLKPEGKDEYAYASRMAMQTYAFMIMCQNIDLAIELFDWSVSECKKAERMNSVCVDILEAQKKLNKLANKKGKP